MSRNICWNTIFKAASVAIFAALFYTSCGDNDDNGVKVVTPEVTTFVDYRDNRTYEKVQIGSQTWMAENLNYAADGSVCSDGGSWRNLDTLETCEKYGRLYDWHTAMDGEHSSYSAPSGVEGVCPVGWHIPSDAEWTTLVEYVGVNAGTKLKSREFHGLMPGETRIPDGTDKYRFAALPGGLGFRGYPSNDFRMGAASWWSSTEVVSNENKAWVLSLSGMTAGVYREEFDKHEYFLSVRCVHD
jgi:uncharacterized protein (TIGR02145 family)